MLLGGKGLLDPVWPSGRWSYDLGSYRVLDKKRWHQWEHVFVDEELHRYSTIENASETCEYIFQVVQAIFLRMFNGPYDGCIVAI